MNGLYRVDEKEMIKIGPIYFIHNMFAQNLMQRKKCLVCLPETTEFAIIASCKLYYSKITIYIYYYFASC